MQNRIFSEEWDVTSPPYTPYPLGASILAPTALELGACPLPPFANPGAPLFGSHTSFVGNDPWIRHSIGSQ